MNGMTEREWQFIQDSFRENKEVLKEIREALKEIQQARYVTAETCSSHRRDIYREQNAIKRQQWLWMGGLMVLLFLVGLFSPWLLGRI